MGLDVTALETALVDGIYRDAVLADEALAHKLGISGVPDLLVRHEGEPSESSTVISGAQPLEYVRKVVESIG